jgi:DNA-binding transcriptional LysR family regulator
MHKDHPLAAHRKIAFADAAQENFVGLTLGSPLQDYLDARTLRDGKPLPLRVRLRTFDGLCRLAEAEVGLAIMPETAARAWRRSMHIAAVRLSDSWATRSLSLCFRDYGALSAHARGLVRGLADEG